MGRTESLVRLFVLSAFFFSFGCSSSTRQPKPTTSAPATTPATNAPATNAPSTTSAPAVAEVATIEIRDFNYGAPLTVAVGTTVKVINLDSMPHTFTALDRNFDSGSLGEGEEFFHTFTEAGEFEFKCAFHSRMRGSIIVSATSAPATALATTPATNTLATASAPATTPATNAPATTSAPATTLAPNAPATTSAPSTAPTTTPTYGGGGYNYGGGGYNG